MFLSLCVTFDQNSSPLYNDPTFSCKIRKLKEDLNFSKIKPLLLSPTAQRMAIKFLHWNEIQQFCQKFNNISLG